MENSVYYNEHEHNHIIDVTTGESTSTSASQGEYNVSREVHNEDMTSTNRATASRLSSSPTTSRSAPLRRRGENHGRRRRNPLNSGLWISIELLANPSQSAQCRHEHPRAPLFTWIIGYTIGCVAILPHLCWRYIHRTNHTSTQESAPTHQHFSRDSSSIHFPLLQNPILDELINKKKLIGIKEAQRKHYRAVRGKSGLCYPAGEEGKRTVTPAHFSRRRRRQQGGFRMGGAALASSSHGGGCRPGGAEVDDDFSERSGGRCIG
ncbi:hypothetical protein KSP40_PGU021125 [Platanthera guangdongensis]|uniref:Uncharacterized protein n=1 Tax=Platanthera guangdongensis TaxID=2320717 RepID=A0ABR2MZG5_9ASPA